MQEITKKNIRIWSMLGMRRVAGIMLKEMAKSDQKFMFATADMARYLGAEDFHELFPGQIIDVGIAEQNLIGIAAGMQKEGLHVFAGTYATFLTARALDQIRVNLGYMNLGVKLIGIAGGLSDARFSPTHMALEDIADMRVIPNITIISPADGVELVKVMEALVNYEGPTYIRLTGGANLPIVYTEDYRYEIGRAVCLREGADLALVAAGTMVSTALKVAKMLEMYDINCKVVNMHTIKPLDVEMLEQLAEFKMLVSIEEHMAAGGLGSAIAEYYAGKQKRPVHQIIGLRDAYPCSCDYEQALEKNGLTAEKITEQVMRAYYNLS